MKDSWEKIASDTKISLQQYCIRYHLDDGDGIHSLDQTAQLRDNSLIRRAIALGCLGPWKQEELCLKKH